MGSHLWSPSSGLFSIPQLDVHRVFLVATPLHYCAHDSGSSLAELFPFVSLQFSKSDLVWLCWFSVETYHRQRMSQCCSGVCPICCWLSFIVAPASSHSCSFGSFCRMRGHLWVYSGMSFHCSPLEIEQDLLWISAVGLQRSLFAFWKCFSLSISCWRSCWILYVLKVC